MDAPFIDEIPGGDLDSSASPELLLTSPVCRLVQVLNSSEQKYSTAQSELEAHVRRFRGKRRWMKIIIGVLSAAMAVFGASALTDDNNPKIIGVVSACLQVFVGIAVVVSNAYDYEEKISECTAAIDACSGVLSLSSRIRDALVLFGDTSTQISMCNISLDVLRDACDRAEAAIPIV